MEEGQIYCDICGVPLICGNMNDFYRSPETGEKYFESPREAFAALFDRIHGKGAWERNPFVWVYDFVLTK
jgi:hypothetical protein